MPATLPSPIAQTTDGARMPTHELTSKPGTPLSMNVGTSGNALERCPLDTAIAFSLPVFTYWCAPATAV